MTGDERLPDWAEEVVPEGLVDLRETALRLLVPDLEPRVGIPSRFGSDA
jgi:hypothetical protein